MSDASGPSGPTDRTDASGPSGPTDPSDASAYRFTTRWRIPARIDRVWRELTDPVAIPAWWPGIEQVIVVRAGDATGTGMVCDCVVRGTLPMTLRFRLEVLVVDRPHRSVEAIASGDLEGRGAMTLTAHDAETIVEYTWDVRAAKPMVRWFSPLLRPVFVRNHDRVMEWGREALVDRVR